MVEKDRVAFFLKLFFAGAAAVFCAGGAAGKGLFSPDFIGECTSLRKAVLFFLLLRFADARAADMTEGEDTSPTELHAAAAEAWAALGGEGGALDLCCGGGGGAFAPLFLRAVGGLRR